MDILMPLLGFLLLSGAITAWIIYGVVGDTAAKKWAIILTGVCAIMLFWLVWSINHKGCNEYMIDDYQQGDVPVNCIGTYNTVPQKKSLYD